jgi:hypothetical protein
MAIISKHYRFILFETITKFSLFQKKVYGLVPTPELKVLIKIQLHYQASQYKICGA